MQLRSLRTVPCGNCRIGGVGVRAVVHAGLVAGQERRSDLGGESEFAELLAPQHGLQDQLGAVLIGRRFVKLLVLLRLVVGIADFPSTKVARAAIWRHSATSCGVRMSSTRYIQLSACARMRASEARALFRLPRRAWQARFRYRRDAECRLPPASRGGAAGCNRTRRLRVAARQRSVGNLFEARWRGIETEELGGASKEGGRCRRVPGRSLPREQFDVSSFQPVISQAQAPAARSASVRAAGR